MKKIQINLGQTITIDNEDLERISQHSWSTSWSKKRLFFVCPGACINYKWVILSRFLMNPPKDKQVDHINRNVLDNRRSNLRVCTNSINGHNRGLFKKNKLGLSGVYFDKYHKKYRSEIKLNSKRFFLGYFKDPQTAHAAYLQHKADYLEKYG